MVFEIEDDLQKYLDGQVILIDKPLNWTSFDVVNKIRYSLKRKFNLKKIKVGHAGTLDPLATGLLIICVGKYTKRISEFQNQPKEYTGTITLGASTPSFDLETEVDKEYPTEHIDAEKIDRARRQFIGDIMQLAPQFSAKKIQGEKAYDLARKGIKADIKPHAVNVSGFEITDVTNLPILPFKINCSKGTYIRSIAHDFGQVLNSGSHLSALRRTKIGEFDVDNAFQLPSDNKKREFKRN